MAGTSRRNAEGQAPACPRFRASQRTALPGALTVFAKVLPLTHAMALMRYGLVDSSGSGLHDIWGMGNTTVEAFLSLGVVTLFAVALGAVAIRAFTRSAVR